jgi:hypothetical protein
MKNGLYRIEVRSQLEELRNGGHVMIVGDGGMAFAEIHPIKIKGTPKKEKPIVGLDGTVYTQDEDKRGWTGDPHLQIHSQGRDGGWIEYAPAAGSTKED